ncbi:hypothetical protein BGW38_000038, partial [Lunasporangiospora selenospora]
PQASSRGGASEHTPLLSSQEEAARRYSTNNDGNAALPTSPALAAIDPVTVYVRVLQEHLPWNKRPSPLWILPAFILPSITSGMIISSLGQFHAVLLCREYMNHHGGANSTIFSVMDIMSRSLAGASGDADWVTILSPAKECQTPEVQAYSAKILGALELLGAIACMIQRLRKSRYYCSLSDKHGRLKIMIVGFSNTIFTLICMYCMSRWWDEVGMKVMVLTVVVGGLLGGLMQNSAVCLAYAADCTDPANRSLVFSWLHAGIFMGLAVGPYIGGLIVKRTGSFMTIVLIDGIASALSLLLVAFVVPESVPSKQSAHIRKLYEEALVAASLPSSSNTQNSNSKIGLLSSLGFFKPSPGNAGLLIMGSIAFLGMLSFKGSFSILILYTNLKFSWGEYEDGIMFSLGAIVRFLSLVALLPGMNHLYHKYKSSRSRQGKGLDQAGAESGVNQQILSTSNSSNTIDSNDTTIEQDQLGLIPNNAISSDSNESDSEAPMQERRRRGSTTDTLQIEEKEKKYRDIKFDTWVLRVGFIINSVTYVGYGLATNTWLFILASSLHAISIITLPSLKTLFTSMVEPSQFGAAMGAIQIVDAIAGVFSPLVISWVYALTVKTFPEFVWYCCAFLTGMCVLLAFMIRQKQFRNVSIV